MRKAIQITAVYLALALTLTAGTVFTPVLNGLLQGNLNGNGSQITNLSGIVTTGTVTAASMTIAGTKFTNLNSIVQSPRWLVKTIVGDYTVGGETNYLTISNILFSVNTTLSNMTLTIPPAANVYSEYAVMNSGTNKLIVKAASGNVISGAPAYTNSYQFKADVLIGDFNTNTYRIARFIPPQELIDLTNGLSSGSGSGNAVTNNAAAQVWSGVQQFTNANNVFAGTFGNTITNSFVQPVNLKSNLYVNFLKVTNYMVVGIISNQSYVDINSFQFGYYGSLYQDGFFIADGQSGTVFIGDFVGDDNSTYIYLDDNSEQTITLRATNGIYNIGTIYGNGNGLTNLNASQLLSGTVPVAALGNADTNGAANYFYQVVTSANYVTPASLTTFGGGLTNDIMTTSNNLQTYAVGVSNRMVVATNHVFDSGTTNGIELIGTNVQESGRIVSVMDANGLSLVTLGKQFQNGQETNGTLNFRAYSKDDGLLTNMDIGDFSAMWMGLNLTDKRMAVIRPRVSVNNPNGNYYGIFDFFCFGPGGGAAVPLHIENSSGGPRVSLGNRGFPSPNYVIKDPGYVNLPASGLGTNSGGIHIDDSAPSSLLEYPEAGTLEESYSIRAPALYTTLGSGNSQTRYALAVVATTNAPTPPPAPTSFYNLDSATAGGSSDTGSLGSGGMTNNSITFTVGKITNSAAFNGSSSWMSCSNPTAAQITGDFSFCAWFQLTNYAAAVDQNLILSRFGSTNIWRLLDAGNSFAPGYMVVSFWDANGTEVDLLLNQIIDTNWHFVAISYVASNKSLNFKLDDTWPQFNGFNLITGPVTNTPTMFSFGATNASDVSKFDGRLDGVGLWNNHALTRNEMDWLWNRNAGYQYGSSQFQPIVPLTTPEGLINPSALLTTNGSGAGLTDLNASQLTSGSITNTARLATNTASVGSFLVSPDGTFVRWTADLFFRTNGSGNPNLGFTNPLAGFMAYGSNIFGTVNAGTGTFTNGLTLGGNPVITNGQSSVTFGSLSINGTGGGNVLATGTATFNNFNGGNFNGNGSGLTSLNGANLTAGSVAQSAMTVPPNTNGYNFGTSGATNSTGLVTVTIPAAATVQDGNGVFVGSTNATLTNAIFQTGGTLNPAATYKSAIGLTTNVFQVLNTNNIPVVTVDSNMTFNVASNFVCSGNGTVSGKLTVGVLDTSTNDQSLAIGGDHIYLKYPNLFLWAVSASDLRIGNGTVNPVLHIGGNGGRALEFDNHNTGCYLGWNDSTTEILSPFTGTVEILTNGWIQNNLFVGWTAAATNGFYSTISNAAPSTTFTLTANTTTFFTNSFGFDILIGFTASTITGVGICGTNGGATGTFAMWQTPLTGGIVPLRANHTASFTNGAAAGNATWTPFP